MKPRWILFGMLLFLGCCGAPTAFATDFSVTSPTLASGSFSLDQIFDGFGCTGKNVSPEIDWSGAPDGTKTFALFMHDPDAPTESGWWHWVVFNIPATTTSLPLGAGSKGGKLPAGAIQSITDFGKAGYGGPCPPPGAPHHYKITVFALKDKIPLKSNASAAMVNFNAVQMSLGKAEMVATYGR